MARVEIVGRHRNQYIPNLCIHCGEPAAGRCSRTFTYQSPFRMLLGLPVVLGLLAICGFMEIPARGADSEMFTSILGQRRMELAVPVCDRHWKAPRIAITRFFWGFLALSLYGCLALYVGFGAAPSLEWIRAFLFHPALLALAGVLVLAWVVAVIAGWHRSMRAVWIGDDGIILKNVAGRFAEAHDRERARVAAILRQPPMGG